MLRNGTGSTYSRGPEKHLITNIIRQPPFEPPYGCPACPHIKLSKSHISFTGCVASWWYVWYKYVFLVEFSSPLDCDLKCIYEDADQSESALVTFVTGNKDPGWSWGSPRIPQLPLFLVDHHLTRRWLWLFPPTSTVYHSQFEVRQQLDFTMQGDVVLKSEFDLSNTFTPNINII